MTNEEKELNTLIKTLCTKWSISLPDDDIRAYSYTIDNLYTIIYDTIDDHIEIDHDYNHKSSKVTIDTTSFDELRTLAHQALDAYNDACKLRQAAKAVIAQTDNVKTNVEAARKALDATKDSICNKWSLINNKNTYSVIKQLRQIAFDPAPLDASIIINASSLRELKKIAKRLLDARNDIQILQDAIAFEKRQKDEYKVFKQRISHIYVYEEGIPKPYESHIEYIYRVYPHTLIIAEIILAAASFEELENNLLRFATACSHYKYPYHPRKEIIDCLREITNI